MDEIPWYERPPLHDDADVLARLDLLVDDDSRCRRSLWLLFCDHDGMQLPVVMPVDDVPAAPDPGLLTGLFSVIGQVLDEHAPGGSAVIALTGAPDDAGWAVEQAWSDALRRGADAAGVTVRARCLVTADGVRPMVAAA